MRAIVDHADFQAQAIRPNALLAHYRELVEVDVAKYLVPAAQESQDSCPACGSSRSEQAFARFGLSYRHCTDCGSLWVAPRPDEAALRRYYRESEAERFWQDELARQTGPVRIAKVIEPRLDWIADAVAEHRPQGVSIADVGTHQSVFAQRFAQLKPFARHLAVEPITYLPDVAGLEVIDQPLEEAGLSGDLDAVTLLDVADRTSDPDSLVAAVHAALKPGGLLFLTGILASGFDIQVLWDRAETVFPPDRLNLFSVNGLEALLKRRSFEVIEYSTPGAFDLRTVAQAREAQPDLPLPRFVETLLTRRGEAEYAQFQTFLQASLLSSFGRVVARRPL